jgi:TPR repeat protein
MRGLAIKAMQGDAASQCQFAAAFKHGHGGIMRSDKLAMEWYSRSANQGYANAQYGLGRYYQEGFSVPRDDAKAVEWYLKAATQGHANAQYEVALSYDQSRGVPKDKSKAMGWYLKSANGGNLFARASYVSLRDNGYKTPLVD